MSSRRVSESRVPLLMSDSLMPTDFFLPSSRVCRMYFSSVCSVVMCVLDSLAGVLSRGGEAPTNAGGLRRAMVAEAARLQIEPGQRTQRHGDRAHPQSK